MIAEHWNLIVKRDKQSGIKPRDYISMSDLGKPYIDRWYKMKGEQPSNPFEDRVLRIFDAGRTMEFIVLRALTLAGILNKKQQYVEIPPTEKTLRCLGYLDCTIGGIVDWNEQLKKIENYLMAFDYTLVSRVNEYKLKLQSYTDGQLRAELVSVPPIEYMLDEEGNEVPFTEVPNFDNLTRQDMIEMLINSFVESNKKDELLENKAFNIIHGLQRQYPNGVVEETLVEAKSINSMAFWAHKNKTQGGKFLGYPHNKLQLYGYQKATKIEKGILLYISKDDFVLEEVGQQLGNVELDKAFNEDVEAMTEYYRAPNPPPVEQELSYNDRKKTFELNWRIARSPYLTKAYGYKSGDEFEEKNHQMLLDINRALKHLREGKVKEEDKDLIIKCELNKYVKPEFKK